MEFTSEMSAKLEQYLATHTLPRGLGDEASMCSAAAINLAMGRGITDQCPDCASPVIWRWMIHIQDRMPDAMRNSMEWKSLLPLVAGSGRVKEKARLGLIRNWMWESLILYQPRAEERGFGPQWLKMTTKRTRKAATEARKAASADAAAATAAAYAADASAATAAAYAADAAAATAAAATAYAADAADAAWDKINPPALLAKLVSP